MSPFKPSNYLFQKIKFINIGQNTIGLDWNIYDYEDFLKPTDRSAFDLKIEYGMDKKYRINFNQILPKEFPEDKQYFTIDPPSSVVGPKNTGNITVTFKTDSTGMKEALFIVYPKINDDTQVKFDDLMVKVIADGLDLI